MKRTIQIVLQAFQALRQGVATELQWHQVVTAMRVADAVAIGRGSKAERAHIAHAIQSLGGIRARAMQSGEWLPVEIHFAEIDAVDVGVEIFADQVSEAPPHSAHYFVHVCTISARNAVTDWRPSQCPTVSRPPTNAARSA